MIGAIRFMFAAYAGEKDVAFDTVATAAGKIRRVVAPEQSSASPLQTAGGPRQ